MTTSDDLRRLDAARRRVAGILTVAMMVLYFGFILLIAYNKPLLATIIVPGLSVGILLGALVIVAAWVLILVLRPLGQPALRRGGGGAAEGRMNGVLGEPNLITIAGFFIFIAISLGITYVAARRTHSTEQFYTAGRQSDRAAERPRARRRLHERGELPRDCRPRGAFPASMGSSTRSASWSAGQS